MGKHRNQESETVTAQFAATFLTRHGYRFITICTVLGITAIVVGLAMPLLLGVK